MGGGGGGGGKRVVGVGEREYWLIRGVEGSGREKILANLGEWGEKGGGGSGREKILAN